MTSRTPAAPYASPPTPLELAREVVAGWHDRLIGDIALIIAEAEARGRAAGLEEAAQYLERFAIENRPHVPEGKRLRGTIEELDYWIKATLRTTTADIRVLAEPSPAVKE